MEIRGNEWSNDADKGMGVVSEERREERTHAKCQGSESNHMFDQVQVLEVGVVVYGRNIVPQNTQNTVRSGKAVIKQK